MTPQKLNVAVAFFCYGGNGGIASEVPDIRDWWAETLFKIKTDGRVAEINSFTISETPITLSRNAAVITARKLNADILVMVDSDMKPDSQIGKSASAKPFWDTAFDFLYANYAKGPHVIGAPYCGPPPHEMVYVFRWQTMESAHANVRDMKLDTYSREEAAQFTGIGQVAALPTGLIAYDMRIFEVTDPEHAVTDMVKAGVPLRKAKLLVSSWFDYEWEDIYHSRKASTEDVVNTRDMSLTAEAVLGYNPLYCAWDCWAGHWKPKCVDKPTVLGTDEVSEKYAHALRTGLASNQKIKHFKMPDDIRRRLETGAVQKPSVLRDAVDKANGNGTGSRDPRVPMAAALQDAADGDGSHAAFIRSVDWYPKVKIGFETSKVDMDTLERIVREHATHYVGKPRRFAVAEIGCWVGASTLTIARACRDAGIIEDTTITCIDHFRGSETDKTKELADAANSKRVNAVLDAFMTNTQAVREYIDLIRMPSETAATWCATRGERFDLIFLDADHSYAGVLSDLKAWWPLLADGGVMVGHDWNDNFPGVQMAVEEYFGQGKADVKHSVWKIVKHADAGTVAYEPAVYDSYIPVASGAKTEIGNDACQK